LIDPLDDSDIELLKQKHGHEPLIYLVRKLIVAIDQTKSGSVEREKTLQLLKVLTLQENIGSNSSDWLDWLEDMTDNQLNWDMIGSLNQKQRKVVSIEDFDEPRENRPRLQPMSKEQEIWAKALDRQKNKGKLSLKTLYCFISLLMIGLLGFGVWRYSSLIDLSFLNDKNTPLESNLISPLDIWGNYQTKLLSPNHFNFPSGKIHADFFNDIELGKLPETIREWCNKKTQEPVLFKQDFGSAYWLGLHELEQRYLSDVLNDNSNFVDHLKPGHRRWTFTRTMNKKILYQGNFSESFTRTDQGWDIQIKRIIEKNGIAHRILIDSNGILAWSWRLKWGETVMEGKVIRKSLGLFTITSSKVWPEQIETRHELPTRNYAPALWTPSFHSRQPEALLFPISGHSCNGSIFWQELEVIPNEEGFLLKSTREMWSELWLLIP